MLRWLADGVTIPCRRRTRVSAMAGGISQTLDSAAGLVPIRAGQVARRARRTEGKGTWPTPAACSQRNRNGCCSATWLRSGRRQRRCSASRRTFPVRNLSRGLGEAAEATMSPSSGLASWRSRHPPWPDRPPERRHPCAHTNLLSDSHPRNLLLLDERHPRVPKRPPIPWLFNPLNPITLAALAQLGANL